jgi:hypothetical protein
MMKKLLVAFGAAIFAQGLISEPAAAKTIKYEINGQVYAYESTRPQEVRVARKLIEAANAADKAQAEANAERARNPLAAIFGSQAQRAAQAARENLEKVIAAEAPRARLWSARAAAPEVAEVDETPQSTREASATDRPDREAAQAKAVKDAETASEGGDGDGDSVKSVHVDPDTGIKTTFMLDGSVREELVESTGSTSPRAGPGAKR